MNEPGQDKDLTAAQAARLLHLGLETDEPEPAVDAHDSRAELLYACLSHPLPADGSVVNFLPGILRPLSRDLTSVAGDALQDLLFSRRTSVAMLERVKDFGKQLARDQGSGAFYDVALVVYHGAIAAAVVYHQKRITRQGDAALAKSFAALAGQDWIGKDLAGLFAEAEACCARNARPSEDAAGNDKPVS